MATKMKKLMAAFLVFTVCVSAFSVYAFAADQENVEIETTVGKVEGTKTTESAGEGTPVITKTETVATTTSMSLYDAIVAGLADSASCAVANELATRDPLEIINSDLIPALDKAGADYENNVIFLPQLLMCASSAKAAFDVIKSNFFSFASFIIFIKF